MSFEGVRMIPVVSSNVRAVGFCDEGLIAKYNGGGTPYIYSNVALSIYMELLASESKGVFLRERIIGTYPCTRLTVEESGGLVYESAEPTGV